MPASRKRSAAQNGTFRYRDYHSSWDGLGSGQPKLFCSAAIWVEVPEGVARDC
jgi:hypothetical protein